MAELWVTAFFYRIVINTRFPSFLIFILWYVPLKNNISHCVIFQINEQGFSGLLSEFCKSALRLFDYTFHVMYYYVLVTLHSFCKTRTQIALDQGPWWKWSPDRQVSVDHMSKMSQRKTKLMWTEVIVRPNCGLSGTYVVSGRVKKYFRILDMEVLMLLMVWNAKVSIAPISFLIQEIPCNTKLIFIQKRYFEIESPSLWSLTWF